MKTIYEPNYRKLIGWISSERRFQDISQANLNIMLGLDNRNHMSKIENFDRKIDVMEYVKICQVLKIDPHEGIDILMRESMMPSSAK